MSHQLALQAHAAVIEVQFVDQNGASDETVDTATVTITNTAGAAVVTDASATADSDNAGRFTYALTPAQTAELDQLTAVWEHGSPATTQTTTLEIIGDYYFTIAEARSSDPTLANTDKYPPEDIIRARAEVMAEAEMITGRSFVPRYKRVVTSGTGTCRLPISVTDVRSIRSVSLDDSAYTEDQLADLEFETWGTLVSPWAAFSAGARNVIVGVEYGLDAPPADMKRAVLTRLRDRLNWSNSAVPDRATSFQVADGGSYALATAGIRGSETGIPDVDAVYSRYAVNSVVIA